MNAFSMAQRAYAAGAAPTRTPRGTEYEAVARITRRLRTSGQSGRGGFAALAEALHDNNRLWTVFASEAADRANPLPADLKARIFYLAEFVRLHSRKVLAGEAGVDPLLEINTAVMRGLGEGGA